jgi:hypothetical protein
MPVNFTQNAQAGHAGSIPVIRSSSSPLSLLISIDRAALRAFRARSRLDAHHQPAVHRDDV